MMQQHYALNSSFPQDNNIHTMDYNGNHTVYFDNTIGTQVQSMELTHFTPKFNALLFARNRSIGPDFATSGTRVYSYQEKDNDDNLIMNLIPVVRISGNFFTNSSTGQFIAGTQLNNSRCTLQSICSAGYYCINGVRKTCAVGKWSDVGALQCNTCKNAPQNSEYTGPGANNDCPWVCKQGFGKNSLHTCSPICAGGFTKLQTSSGLAIPVFATKNTSPSIYLQYNGLNVLCRFSKWHRARHNQCKLQRTDISHR